MALDITSLSDATSYNNDSIGLIKIDVDRLTTSNLTLSNQLAITNNNITSLSNTLRTEYITLSDLDSQLRQNYIQQGEKVDFRVEKLTTSNISQNGLSPINVTGVMHVNGLYAKGTDGSLRPALFQGDQSDGGILIPGPQGVQGERGL